MKTAVFTDARAVFTYARALPAGVCPILSRSPVRYKLSASFGPKRCAPLPPNAGMAFKESAFRPLKLSEAQPTSISNASSVAQMSYASAADEVLDDGDELVLLLLLLSDSFSPHKACSLSFFLAAGRHAMVLQRGRVTWKGIAGRRALADAPLTRIYRKTVADFGTIPEIFNWLSFNTTYKRVAIQGT